jgi:hypothetical protein
VTYPLITLSTRAQVDAKGEHRSITAALKKIIDKEGVAGLYAGLKSALFGIGITNGIHPLCCPPVCAKLQGFTTFGTNGPKPSWRKPPSNPPVANDL